MNLDWLEVHALEPFREPRTADYFRRAGFIVHEREYGTRVYKQMFTLEGTDGEPLLEIRREPKSTGVIGIHQINECHIRLHNRTCYFDNAAALLSEFLSRYDYTFMRISRVDVCYDFVRFDKGDLPQKFVERYLKHKYAKINQGRIHAHGDDEWSGQSWNSLSWGAKKSAVGTKLYNKSLQLQQVKDKPYIRWAWYMAGLVDDPISCTTTKPDGTKYTPDIWRVEFSVTSPVKKWVAIEVDGKPKNYRSLRNTLDVWDTRDKLWHMFASLARHYFHFKKYQADVRKDRCEDKVLFDFGEQTEFYKVEHVPTARTMSDELESLARRLQEYRSHKSDNKLRTACDIILKAIHDDRITDDCYGIIPRAEILALQQTIALRAKENNLDPMFIYHTLLKSIKDNKLPFSE